MKVKFFVRIGGGAVLVGIGILISMMFFSGNKVEDQATIGNSASGYWRPDTTWVKQSVDSTGLKAVVTAKIDSLFVPWKSVKIQRMDSLLLTEPERNILVAVILNGSIRAHKCDTGRVAAQEFINEVMR